MEDCEKKDNNVCTKAWISGATLILQILKQSYKSIKHILLFSFSLEQELKEVPKLWILQLKSRIHDER